MMDRVILHCDMNSFFCSVELLEHPELADRPVAVAGSADDRHGIILAKNQIAKSFGVVTPETIFSAKKNVLIWFFWSLIMKSILITVM